MADRLKLTDTAAAPNGARTDALPRGDMLRVEPPTTAPRRRLPELVLGIFLVAGCALAALLLAASGRERTPVLALSGDVQRGQVIDANDLRVVYVGWDTPIAYLEQGSEGEVVGNAALSDLRAGTLVTAEQFAAPSEVLDANGGQVGFALDAGQMPSMQLAPGDHVNVVAAGATSGQQARVVADGAEVVEVDRIEDESGQANRWWVSLSTSENEANELGMAVAGDNPVQLVLVQG